MQASLRVMLAQTLGSSDAVSNAGMGEKLMKVILDDRNAVVLKDLEELVAQKPELGTIAIFYGAAHLPQMQRELVTQRGYRVEKDEWLRAMGADLKSAGLSRAQADAMIKTIEKSRGKRGK
jgi:hypothetical protein